MSEIADNKVASVHYTGTLPDTGEVFDSSEGREALTFLVGHKQMIPGFERELMGSKQGDKVEFTLSSEDAYGEHMPEAVQEVPTGMFGEITPESISNFSQEEIASCGLTKSKASYILGIANNPEDFLSPNFSEMSDAEINKHFVSFRGIGPWTSEMLMIFGLLRPDIFSIGDIGLVKAVKILKPSIETKEEVTAFAERWSPFRTAASWYLWRMLDPVPVAY